jgi:hypothetical protein
LKAARSTLARLVHQQFEIFFPFYESEHFSCHSFLHLPYSDCSVHLCARAPLAETVSTPDNTAHGKNSHERTLFEVVFMSDPPDHNMTSPEQRS